MQVLSNSARFECQVDGTPGRDWLVFSHAIATDLSLWDEQVRAFGDRFSILRYDTRGHGGSSVPPGPYGFDDLVADAIGLFDHFGIARAHYVGLSLGGMTALGLGIQHPDRLLSIGVCDARPDSPPAFRDPWTERIALARSQGMTALVQPTLQRWLAPAAVAQRPSIANRIGAMIARTPVEGFAACAAALQELDYEAGLATIRIPTLLLAGASDGPIPEINRRMAGIIPGARNMLLPDAGHISNIEQPEAFNAALAGFLDNLAR